MKKTLALFLVLMSILALPAIAESEYEKPIEITWMIPTQQSISLGESIPTKTLLEKFNVQVNWIELSPNDQHPEKLSLLLAARELPDIITWVNKSDAAAYGEEGAYLEITPYLESYFPNLSSVLERESASHYAAYTLDDKLWFIPGWTRTSSPNWGWSVDKEAFESVGYPLENLQSFEDYKAALKALKEEYPDSYPLSHRGGEVPFANFLSSFIIPFTEGKAGYGMIAFDYELGEWKVAASVDGYKESLMYVSGLYEEGLLDPEFLTLTMDDLVLRFNDDKVFATVDYVGGLSGVGDFQGQIDNVLYPIEWPSPVEDVESIMGSKAIALTERGTVLPAALADEPEKLERICTMLDFMYSEEWYDIFYNNPELVDSEGDGTKYIEDYYAGRDNLRDLYLPWAIFASFQDDPLREDVEPGTPWADFCIAWGNEFADRLAESVIMPFDTETQMEVNDLSNAVLDYWNANVMQFVVGQTDFEQWDAFIDNLMRVGGADLEKIYNETYQELYGE